MHEMKVTPSTYHSKVSCMTCLGQVDLFGSQLASQQCYQIGIEKSMLEKKGAPGGLNGQCKQQLLYKDETNKREYLIVDLLICVGMIKGKEDKFTFIKVNLHLEENGQIVKFFRRNIDVFGWEMTSMLRISLNVTCHKLGIRHDANL